MGAACSRENQDEKGETTKNLQWPVQGEPPDIQGEVHILIVGLDYSCDRQSWAGPPPAGHGPLDTSYAVQMMQQLADVCQVASQKFLWNQQATRQGLINAIYEVSSKCGPNDYFVFYYTGHGDQLPDNEEADFKDECLCLVDDLGNTDDPSMQYRFQTWMRDDEFVDAIVGAFEDNGTHMLFLLDCCHSASLCDFETDRRWFNTGINAVSISGCQDSQTSAGTGKGGMFTRALTMAIQDLSQAAFQTGAPMATSVAEVYNRTITKYEQYKTFGHTQNITVSHTPMVRPDGFPWPLNPQGFYVAPANASMRGAPNFDDEETESVADTSGGYTRSWGPPPIPDDVSDSE